MPNRPVKRRALYGSGFVLLYVATFFIFMDPKEPAVREYQIVFHSSSRFGEWQYGRSSSGFSGRKFKAATFANYLYFPIDFVYHLVWPNDRQSSSYRQFDY